MQDNTYKQKLLDTGLFRKTSGNCQYRMRECYYCGDNKSHFYARIDLNNDDPVVFNCFKCNLGEMKSNHILNKHFLEYHNLENIKIPKMSKIRKINSSDSTNDNYPLIISDNENSKNINKYIKQRIGVMPTLSELQEFQFISNPVEYVRENLGGKLSMREYRLWFRLSNGNMNGRLNHDNGIRWRKYNNSNSNTKGVYTIRKEFDLRKVVNVIIAEGIMDVIGLYYHYPCDNTIFIAVLGSNYVFGLEHLISMGIFGKNVNIKFFKDRGIKKIKVDEIHRQMFGKIEIYRNAIGKDYGVDISNLEIEKCV